MAKHKKRRSEAPKGDSDAKRQKVVDKDLYAFLDSTLKLVSDLPTAIDFMKLPSKKYLPDYYDIIKTPISIQEIKSKVNSKVYTTADEFVADFQLMADNANTYNVEESEIAQNSIQILNFVKDQVSQHNETNEADDEPEYEPESEEDEEPVKSVKKEKELSTPAKSNITRIKVKPPAPPGSNGTPAKTPGTPGTPHGGMTQKARFLMVLDELINYEVDGTRIGDPFANEVSRKEFPDYYRIIKKPMSLNTVKENILAGRIKSMGQFQNQVELVWKNAQAYNDEGTLLYSDSITLQDYFHKRMDEVNREIEAARVAALKERGDSPGMPSVKLKIKPPKTKLSLTLHAREGTLPIPDELALGNTDLLGFGEQHKEHSESDSDVEMANDDEQPVVEEQIPQEPELKLPSTGPRVSNRPASEASIQEIVITSSRSVYKQVSRPMSSAGTPLQPIQNWFEHRFLASDFPVSSYAIVLQRQQGAVSVSAGLNDDLLKKKHQASLTVNGERVNPVPSIHYADSGRQLTSRYELKLPLGLNTVVFEVAVDAPAEESRTRLQEQVNMKIEKLTFWIQVL